MIKKLLFLFIVFLFSYPSYSQDTFSITAIDTVTGEVGSAGASCVANCIILSDVHPGVGIIHTQASYNSVNQNYARFLMQQGYPPQQIIDSLVNRDVSNNPTIRQYGIIDYRNGVLSRAAYTGINCINYKNHILGTNYTIQGNILLGQQILDSMEARFLNTPGSLAHKLMAALQGAKVLGADTRCFGRGTSSISAFLRVARTQDTTGTYYLNLNVGNTPVGLDPIDSLQVLFNNIVLGITTISENIPDNFSLDQNYPNPFNPETNISFNIPVSSFVEMKIYNINGEEIETLLNTFIPAGSYRIIWRGGSLSSGIYYYTLSARSGSDIFKHTRKMVLLK
jgi:uncharacterized Ntn-hydrolase superfamily protein